MYGQPLALANRWQVHLASWHFDQRLPTNGALADRCHLPTVTMILYVNEIYMNGLEISTTGIIKAYVLIYGLSRYFCLAEWAVNQGISVQGM